MLTNYQPKDIEQSTYAAWEQANCFKPTKKSGPAYSIVIPPPNVTGTLHMGHGFQHTIMDTLIRYHRMSGDNTLWQPGTDHAGIATQMVVERQLQAEGEKRTDLGREAFLDRVWQWKEQSGHTISQQIRRMGSSPDWTRDRFTMDPGFDLAVRDVFVKLYDEGLIYRGKRLVNWDPKLLTAISDLEVISEEEKGHLWHIRYPLTDNSGYLTVATTRPETMLGDVAVAVSPKDERYIHLIGKTLTLPLTQREIPIIADDYVDPEFGSGCVKITPAHDFNDYAIGKRHSLPMINIFTPDAKINTDAPTEYQGLDRFAARKKIIHDLTELGLLEKTEPHTLKIPRGERTGEIVEPYLTDQWYVKIAPLAEPAIDAVKSGKIKFVPENWSKTYFQWMENIEDWCISRQLWWGHRIPAWYDNQGNIYIAQDEKTVREKYHLDSNIELKQDEDVLDTWFSSAIWPFATLGWPNDLDTLKTFYPTSVLVTGFDIIFFWVARMIMFGLKFTNQVPFKEIYITGLIRDSEGQKMSKSKGNILDPIDLIDGIDLATLISKRTYGLMQPGMAKKIEDHTRKEFPEGIASHGADALRFTYCAIANNSRDINFDMKRLDGYRNFCNKLWNASKFVLMNTENFDIAPANTIAYSVADRWIQTKLQETIQLTHRYFAEYRFDYLAQALYEFTWYEFCDWYLELAKVVLNNETTSTEEKAATRLCLLTTLETILRLMHPIMPFITETIWHEVAPLLGLSEQFIMLRPYPREIPPDLPLKKGGEILSNLPLQKEEESFSDSAIVWLKEVSLAIRNIRGEMNISPSKKIAVLLRKGSEQDRSYYSEVEPFLIALNRLQSCQWLSDNEEPPASATAIVGTLELFLPMSDLIDKQAELVRLSKEMEKIKLEIEKIQTKLSNSNFVDKAPKEVVAKEHARLEELQHSSQKLAEQHDKIKML